ncbi:MAG: quinone-interacting membrane-bound oxidoreductase complex subunit QmoC [candidate division Zixibacteria bacterium]
MKLDENTTQDQRDNQGKNDIQTSCTIPEAISPVEIESDLDFIISISKRAGETFVKCFQCGTCSAVCKNSPDTEPFPRKEMAWANWGMKDALLSDPDIWLCYNCNDCSVRCPRDARPSDVLGAIRQETITQFAFPRFLARWMSQPGCIPLLLGIPALLLSLALFLKSPIENKLGLMPKLDESIVFSYSSVFPHWLLNSFFIFFSILALLAVALGVTKYWQALKSSRWAIHNSAGNKLSASIITVLKNIITHDNFTSCQDNKSRYLSHILIFFGFIALCAVTFWIITSGINPLIHGEFVYPFNFWSPWKILANLGGLALIAGCLLMIQQRAKNNGKAGAGSYFDWALITTLLIVVLTGFMTEVLHYVRLEPHRHLAYFIHLMFVFALLIYLPYSKLAHIFYRTTAMIYSEYSGRNAAASSIPEKQNSEHQDMATESQKDGDTQ